MCMQVKVTCDKASSQKLFESENKHEKGTQDECLRGEQQPGLWAVLKVSHIQNDLRGIVEC